MKTIMIIDGGPRRNMNTAAMINAFAEGAAGEDVQVKVVRLYELDYKGCMSCLACKVKGSRYHDVCAYKDGLTDVLRDCAYADGLVLASPIYFGQITAQLRGFIERLVFPWLSYNDYSVTAPKRIPTAFIYTMNMTPENAESIQPQLEQNEGLIGRVLQMPERIVAYNTLQVKDYDRYDMAGFSAAAKQKWHESHWAEDLSKAADAGRRMTEKIMNER